jgi:hypothetical protein
MVKTEIGDRHQFAWFRAAKDWVFCRNLEPVTNFLTVQFGVCHRIPCHRIF